MATILEIKTQNEDNIRSKTLPGSILHGTDADMRDTVANEIRDRGVLQAANTGALASLSQANSKLAVVKDVGLFQILVTGTPPNGTTTFTSADSGYLWEKVIGVTVTSTDPEAIPVDDDYEYELADGFMIDKIGVKPTAATTLKVGSTDGGDQYIIATPLTVNAWNFFNTDIYADGGTQSVFITGITTDATIAIYKRTIPT